MSKNLIIIKFDYYKKTNSQLGKMENNSSVVKSETSQNDLQSVLTPDTQPPLNNSSRPNLAKTSDQKLDNFMNNSPDGQPSLRKKSITKIGVVLPQDDKSKEVFSNEKSFLNNIQDRTQLPSARSENFQRQKKSPNEKLFKEIDEEDNDDSIGEGNVIKNDTAKKIRPEVDNLLLTKKTDPQKLQNPEEREFYDFEDNNVDDFQKAIKNESKRKLNVHNGPNLTVDINTNSMHEKSSLSTKYRQEPQYYKEDQDLIDDGGYLSPNDDANDISQMNMVPRTNNEDRTDEFDFDDTDKLDETRNIYGYQDDKENMDNMGYQEEYNDEQNDIEMQVKTILDSPTKKFIKVKYGKCKIGSNRYEGWYRYGGFTSYIRNLVGKNMPIDTGKITYEDGGSYEGEWRFGLKNGFGKEVTGENTCYEGHWKNDKKSGHGLFTNKNGDLYMGNWNNGCRDGVGKEQLVNGDVYEGTYIKGWRDGHFKVHLENRGTYEGQFKYNKYDGTGKETFANGDRFEGEFQNGLRNGIGKLICKDGERYEGEWERGLKHGYGKQHYLNGSFYEGCWKNGMRKGNGTMKFSDGSYYQGSWKKDHRDGMGIEGNDPGDTYEGEWRAGKLYGGRGKLNYANGDCYEGEFVDGLRQGQGSLTYYGGDLYVGQWINDMKEGDGCETYVNGKVLEGVWKKGKFWDGEGWQDMDNGKSWKANWVKGVKDMVLS